MKVMGLLTLLLATVVVSGCVRSGSVSYGDDRHYDGGPPPHAPAHGYRAKHRHHNMVYDSRLGAYVVLGYKDHYYHDGWYFRYYDRLWQISAELGDRRWRDVDRYQVPEGLRYSKHHYRDREQRDYGDRRYKNDKKRANGHDYNDDRGKGRGRGNDQGEDWDD